MAEVLAKPARPWALRLVPPFPAIASRVLALVENEAVAAKQIGEIIKLDPSFTAQILQVANSPLFGVVREIATVRHAVSLLGLNRVKGMATMIALHSMVKPTMRVEVLRRLWVHSLVTAILTDQCARAAAAKVDGAYTAGLLHNLGTLGLMSAYPEEYARMLAVAGEGGYDLLRTERDLFEIDHCAAGALLAEEWNFPDAIIEAIAVHHHAPQRSASLSGLVQVSWRLADALGYPSVPEATPPSYDELIAMIPFTGDSWIHVGIDKAKDEVAIRLGDWPTQ